MKYISEKNVRKRRLIFDMRKSIYFKSVTFNHEMR